MFSLDCQLTIKYGVFYGFGIRKYGAYWVEDGKKRQGLKMIN
jgi:hypothetical protein